jgi:CHAT domain-containing protein
MKAFVLLAGALLACGPASAQKMSMAPDAFLADINSVSGVSRIGGALLAAEPSNRKWGDYCTASQALAQQGEFRQAIRMASRALYLGESSGSYGAVMIYSTNDIATAYSYAGDHATAMMWSDRTLAAVSKGFESSARQAVLLITANARRIRALALSHDGKHAEAIAEMTKAIDALPGSGAPTVRAELGVALVALYTRAGEFTKATEALASPLKETDPYLQVIANRAAGDLDLARGDAAAAKGHYRTALAAMAANSPQFPSVMAHLGLARAARMAGDAEGAGAELSQALAGIEQLRQAFSSSELRTALYGDLQSVFDEAVDFYDSRGDVERSFAASEMSRARAMLDLQRKVEFAGAATPAVRPSGLRDIQARLTPGQVMVAYHQLPQKLMAWVVTGSALRAKALPLTATKAQTDVIKLRHAIEEESTSTVALAGALYRDILEPLQVPAGDVIVFVPHKSLHLLPFQALHDGSRWLIEKNPVATALSASLYEAGASEAGSLRLAALGNPDLGRPEWSLPGAEAEVKAIQALYGDNTVYVQKEASKSHLAAVAPGAQVLHIAAHAVVDEVDPMYSTIKLAVTGLPTGRAALPQATDMEAREVAALDLRSARLVSLSACNSGLGKVAAGDEFMGFKRALFTAGAHSALVSLWPVEDESTGILMTSFHQGWKQSSKAKAMQAAQVKVLSDPKFARPRFWAAFTLVGEPG